MIRREKGLELMNFLYNPFDYIGSKMFLTLKIMDFQNVALTKVVHHCVIKGMNA
jgi:hypothetical protein